ncbi:phage holin family protein [Bacteroides sp. 214]|uniref:phage holin family protein n=1 Tax=Bacteroides sp. 214 TaxID=2302935 RepID=UPI0013D3DA18|nr:phage holin family protein [Bacteroides sp. 214]NDW11579.1 phage holin family protein [Bacteroides sp. 214]
MTTDNNSNFQQLLQETKKYLELQKDYIKLELTEKLTIFFSTFILAMVLIILGVVVLFYLSLAFASFLEPHVGGITNSYLIVAGIIALLMLLFYLLRGRLIMNNLVRFLANLFLNDSNK